MPSTTRPGGAADARTPGPKRRSLLAGAVGLAATTAVAGCTAGNTSAAGDAPPAGLVKRLRRQAAEDSEALLTRYTSTMAAHPALSERLEPLRETVARHVEAFGGTVPRTSPSGRRSGAPVDAEAEGAAHSPYRRSSADRNHMAVPSEEAEALAALAAAERRTADARTRALTDAPPEVARVLASVAAAGGVHAYLLTAQGEGA